MGKSYFCRGSGSLSHMSANWAAGQALTQICEGLLPHQSSESFLCPCCRPVFSTIVFCLLLWLFLVPANTFLQLLLARILYFLHPLRLLQVILLSFPQFCYPFLFVVLFIICLHQSKESLNVFQNLSNF